MCITSRSSRSLQIQLLPIHLAKVSGDSNVELPNNVDTNIQHHAEQEDYLVEQHHFPERVNPSLNYSHGKESHDTVQNIYHDHSTDPVVDASQIKHKAKGGVVIPFPVKLHSMLDAIECDGYADVVSWQPHGRCFLVHKPNAFVNHVMPKYFKQTKMASFQRQLNLYGFSRITNGLDKGAYYHELFLRGKISLAYDIQRTRVKGTGVRMPTNPEYEPNFYELPVVPSFGNALPFVSLPLKNQVDTKMPAAQMVDFEQIRGKSEDYFLENSRCITNGSTSLNAAEAENTISCPEDLVFFEGCPFHYLDPLALVNARRCSFMRTQDPLTKKIEQFKSTSSIVSESSDDEDSNVHALSNTRKEWTGTQSDLNYANTVSPNCVLSMKDDMDSFFSNFEMPVNEYHEQIEKMSEDDDTAFGYLLEQAILG